MTDLSAAAERSPLNIVVEADSQFGDDGGSVRHYMADFDQSQLEMSEIQRAQFDISAEPGASTLSTPGVWVRSQSDWQAGSGQTEFDSDASRRDRATFISGLEFGTPGELRLAGAPDETTAADEWEANEIYSTYERVIVGGALYERTAQGSGQRSTTVPPGSGAEDGWWRTVATNSAGGSFTVTVPPSPGAHVQAKGVKVIESPTFVSITDLCCDGTNLWLLDDTFKKLIAYTVADLSRDSTLDIDLHTANTMPLACDMWSDGYDDTIYVLDKSRHIYAYDKTDGTRLTTEEFDFAADDNPRGIGCGSDGTTRKVYISDASAMYSYNESDKSANGAVSSYTGTWPSGRVSGYYSPEVEDCLLSVVEAANDRVRIVGETSSTPNTSRLRIDGLSGHGNGSPLGVAVDANTIWVSDSEDNKVYGYGWAVMGDVASPGAGIFPPDPAATLVQPPRAVAATSSTIYVGSSGTAYAYAHDGTRQSSNDIALTQNQSSFNSMATDGTTLWVGDGNSVNGYDIATEAYDSAKSVTLTGGFGYVAYYDGHLYQTYGVWNTYQQRYVLVGVRAYRTSDMARVSSKDIRLSGSFLRGTSGIAIAEGVLFLSEVRDDFVRAYSFPDGARISDRDFWSKSFNRIRADLEVVGDKLYAGASTTTSSHIAVWPLTMGWHNPTEDINPSAGSGEPIDVTAVGTNLLVLDATGSLLAYSQAAGTRVDSADITLDSANTDPKGVTATTSTVWVADQTGAKLYAYAASDGSRSANEDVALGTLGAPLAGMTNDGSTIWVCSSGDRKLYGYDISAKARDSDKDIEVTDEGISTPVGCSTDGTTIWVSGEGQGTLWAYTLDGGRDETKDFTTLASAGNTDPRGGTVTGGTMWLCDGTDARLYAYLTAGDPTAATVRTVSSASVPVSSAIRGGTTLIGGLPFARTSTGRLVSWKAVADGDNERIEFLQPFLFGSGFTIPAGFGLTYAGNTLWASRHCGGAGCDAKPRRWEVGELDADERAVLDDTTPLVDPNGGSSESNIAVQDMDHIVGYAGDSLVGMKHTPGGTRVLQADANGDRIEAGIWWLVPEGQQMLAGIDDRGNSLVEVAGRVFFGTSSVSLLQGVPSGEAGGQLWAMGFGTDGLLTVPVQAAVLPAGERLNRVVTDGTLLCLLTSAGVRFCAVGDEVAVGPLIELSELLAEEVADYRGQVPDDAMFLNRWCYVLFGTELLQFDTGTFLDSLIPAWGHVGTVPDRTRRRLVPVGRQGEDAFSVGVACSSDASDEGELWWQRETVLGLMGVLDVGDVRWGTDAPKRVVGHAVRRRFGNKGVGTVDLQVQGEDDVGFEVLKEDGESLFTGLSERFRVSIVLARGEGARATPVLTTWELLASPFPVRYVECEMGLMMDERVAQVTGSPVAMDMAAEFARFHRLALEGIEVKVRIGVQAWRGQVLGVGVSPTGRDDDATGYPQGVLPVRFRFHGPPAMQASGPYRIV